MQKCQQFLADLASERQNDEKIKPKRQILTDRASTYHKQQKEKEKKPDPEMITRI